MNKLNRIIVCLDGTWNTPEAKTNVWRFLDNVDTTFDNQTWEYKCYYASGVGAQNYPIIGGAFGYGITDQILGAYKHICKNYKDEKDEIWLIGFSRGAFAARSLSGLIYNVGLLPEKNLNKVKEAYALYRDRSDTSRPQQELSIAFREKYECKTPKIKFLGCFDTVGSLGVPKLPWYLGGSLLYSLCLGLHGFHDTKLVPIVEHAYHALSIHDQREWFHPTLMNYASNGEKQRLEQVWFPGMHTDVGGYEKDSLLPYHALQWMSERATKHGLKFKQEVPEKHREFIFQDSYNYMAVYKSVNRVDRTIEEDDAIKQYTEAQLYRYGDFSQYMTADQLAMYPSQTLNKFYQAIEAQ